MVQVKLAGMCCADALLQSNVFKLKMFSSWRFMEYYQNYYFYFMEIFMIDNI